MITLPYIILGIGVLIVGLAILVPDKKPPKKLNSGDNEASFHETATASDAFYENLNSKLDDFIGELSSNLHLAGDQLDAKIAQIASRQDSLTNLLARFSELKGEERDRSQHLPQKHRDVLALKQKGLNVEEIATRLNIGKGEVEIILSLYEAGDKN